MVVLNQHRMKLKQICDKLILIIMKLILVLVLIWKLNEVPHTVHEVLGFSLKLSQTKYKNIYLKVYQNILKNQQFSNITALNCNKVYKSYKVA